jgi:hypothetical protein
MTQRFSLKRDAFRDARGGYARFLNIYCIACRVHVLLYQKDGPGVLYRLYLDRIVAPEPLASLQLRTALSQIPDLVCSSCGAGIGTPCIWEEENRLAFLLKEGSVLKRVGKGIYPPEASRA